MRFCEEMVWMGGASVARRHQLDRLFCVSKVARLSHDLSRDWDEQTLMKVNRDFLTGGIPLKSGK